MNYGGLTLRSPVIVASAGITKGLSNAQKAEQYGAGAVVLKTNFQEPLMAKSPTPRFMIIKRGKGDYSSVTNISYEQGYEFGIDQYCEEIRMCKRELDIKIIASIGCSTLEYWDKWTKMICDAGADAVEMNLSCPHSDYVLDSLGQLNAMIRDAVPRVKALAKVPVFTKMTPQIENPVQTAMIMQKSGSDGVVAFSRCLGMDIDVEQELPMMHGGYGGHGGPWAMHYALRWVSDMYPKLKIPISGCNGVVDWEDVVKYILCGATTIQVCFLIYAYGYSVIKELNDGLLAYMDKKGYESVDDFRGNVIDKIKGLYDVDREKTLIAAVNPQTCTGCARCAGICIYDGIDFSEKRASVNGKCDGCGLCPYFCKFGALSMVKR